MSSVHPAPAPILAPIPGVQLLDSPEKTDNLRFSITTENGKSYNVTAHTHGRLQQLWMNICNLFSCIFRCSTSNSEIVQNPFKKGQKYIDLGALDGVPQGAEFLSVANAISTALKNKTVLSASPPLASEEERKVDSSTRRPERESDKKFSTDSSTATTSTKTTIIDPKDKPSKPSISSSSESDTKFSLSILRTADKELPKQYAALQAENKRLQEENESLRTDNAGLLAEYQRMKPIVDEIEAEKIRQQQKKEKGSTTTKLQPSEHVLPPVIENGKEVTGERMVYTVESTSGKQTWPVYITFNHGEPEKFALRNIVPFFIEHLNDSGVALEPAVYIFMSIATTRVADHIEKPLYDLCETIAKEKGENGRKLPIYLIITHYANTFPVVWNPLSKEAKPWFKLEGSAQLLYNEPDNTIVGKSPMNNENLNKIEKWIRTAKIARETASAENSSGSTSSSSSSSSSSSDSFLSAGAA